MRRDQVAEIIRQKYREYGDAVVARLQAHGVLSNPDWRGVGGADAWLSFTSFTNRDERIVDGAYVGNEWEGTEAERLVTRIVDELLASLPQSEVDLLWLLSERGFQHERRSPAEKRADLEQELYDRVYSRVQKERIHAEDLESRENDDDEEEP